MIFVFWEVMLFLEGLSFSKALLGMICAISIQRWFYKLIITLFLTREFKADLSNIAFWTGKWYGLGLHAMSQPGRELLCKMTEMGFFAADFILGHTILFLMAPIILIPYVDMVHSMMLFWLRPSRQIRPPIYTAKQTKLRRKRVTRFSVLYFFLLIIFLALFVGPVIAKSFLYPTIKSINIPMKLMQPYDGMWNKTDTAYWLDHIEELNDGSNLTSQGDADGVKNPVATGSSATSTAKLRFLL